MRTFCCNHCRWFPLGVVALILASAGCRREAPIWEPNRETEQLTEKAQSQIGEYLAKYCGTPSDPKLLGQADMPREHLLQGQVVYMKRCAPCHGATGDGAGPAANFLNPRPRDYRKGVFKFTSTPYGAKPLREDLVRTVREGAIGTAMPSFHFVSDEDIQSVIDYVLVLTHRGELETMLLAEAQSEDTIDSDNVPIYVKRILDRWLSARSAVVTPASAYLPYSAEFVKIGEQAFLTEKAGCYKCHGRDGRGEIIPNAVTEPGAPPVRSADLTSGMFHGGDRPIDIYRRIYSGINGTPMPGFANQFKDDPATIWHLVHYVEYISGARRRELQAEEAEYAEQQGAPSDQTKPVE